MEKLDYLLWRTTTLPVQLLALHAAVPALLEHCAALTVSTADTDVEVPRPSLLLGRGPELLALVEFWVDSLDVRRHLEALLPAPHDGYLVTESVPQQLSPRSSPDGVRCAGLTHLTWFPKPDHLTDEDFFRGWHDVHTPSSAALHPLRRGYVRDAVARVLTPGSPPLRAIVSERFDEVRDYADPTRLFGGPLAQETVLAELPLYADLSQLNSRPLWRTVYRDPVWKSQDLIS